MARTIAEIFNSIVSEKDTLATLDGLLEGTSTQTTAYKRLLNDISSGSKVAVWQLWVFIISVASWVEESLWDEFKTELEDLAASAISGNTAWYLNQVFAFQYGYDLSFIDGKFQYSTIDEEAQIIKRAALVEAAGELRIKIAKLDGTGNPIPLTTAEKNGFSAYINKVKFAGTKLLIINDSADQVRFNLNIYYNPLIAFDIVKSNVEGAISGYLANLEFNGALNITRLIDNIQSAEGAMDVVINSIEARYGALNFASFTREYIPNSGYIEVIGGLPLATITNLPNGSIQTNNDQDVIITYIPNV